MATSARGFVNGHRGDVGQVSRGHGQVDVTVTDGLHAIPRQVHQAGHRRKCHLPAQRQHERFKQQRKAVQLAHPIRFHEPHRTVRQTDTRHAHLQITVELEEIQVAQPFDDRVVHRVFARHPGIGKPAAGDKVHRNRQFRAEIDALHIPGRLDSQGGFKQLGLIRHSSLSLAGLVAAFCRNQPCTSLFTPRASSVRFAGLAPALDPASTHSRFERGQFLTPSPGDSNGLQGGEYRVRHPYAEIQYCRGLTPSPS